MEKVLLALAWTLAVILVITDRFVNRIPTPQYLAALSGCMILAVIAYFIDRKKHKNTDSNKE